MYRSPYDDFASGKAREEIKKIDSEIDKEKKNTNPDRHRMLRLEEQKLLQEMFCNEYGVYNKFRSPW